MALVREEAVVSPLPHRRRRIVRLGVVAAALALAVSWAIAGTLAARVHGIERSRAALRSALGVIGDPSATQTALHGGSGSLVAAYRPDGRVALIGSGLRPPSGGHIYELWLLNGSAVPVRVFTPDDGSITFQAKVTPGNYRGVAITMERSFVQAPTSQPVYTGTFVL